MSVEGGEYRAVAGFGGGVREQQPVFDARAQPRGGERGGSGDEAVHQHRQTHLRAGDVTAGEGGDLETADAAQGFQRRGDVAVVQVERAPDDLHFARDTVGVKTGAGTGELFRRCVEQGAGERRRRGGIADAHLTADE